MYSLGMRREFSARHYLIGGDWGEENIDHAHRYQLELILEKKKLDQHGFLVDIVDVERHLTEAVASIEGKTLNNLKAFQGGNPSIERLAKIFHDMFMERLASFDLSSITITIWEDDIAWTSYRVGL